MKNTLVLAFAATTLALGVLCVAQWQKLNRQESQMTSLRVELDQQAQQLADVEAAKSLVDKQRRELLDQAGDLAAKLQSAQQAAAHSPQLQAGEIAAPESKSGKKENPFGSLLAKMMEDPDTRKMIREQQRMMLNQLYDPLIKRMNLTPEEADQFKELLADNMIQSSEKAMSLMDGSSTNRTAMASTMAETQKAFDEQIRGFLGESRYAQYQDYQQTVGERTQLSQFQQQFAGSENALTDSQTEQLLQFMKEEKQHVAAATGQPAPGPAQDAANLEAVLSGDSLEKLMQNQEAVNQRVYERAAGVLAENQLAAFGRFQTNQLQMMRMGMSMARKFMAPDSQPTP
ncbi:MAG: hypothetical protein KIS67_03330 [Verrucomicrobiae bacterium]|nr:hypothetical protein [Verrucomicrobiae bacterium]